MKLYRYFLDGAPWYLARHYWWAYLWKPAVWFFDHQIIINLILFGQYKSLMRATLLRIERKPQNKLLQLTCVYGALSDCLLKLIAPNFLHITDVSDIQLNSLRKKVNGRANLLSTRMNVEKLAYRSDCFSTIVVFFLLHEMPPEARERTLSEVMRVLAVGGQLLFTEYAPLPKGHFLYQFIPSRWLITKLEPFLTSYWKEDIASILDEVGKTYGKCVEVASHELLFLGFYRVTEFRILELR